MPLDHDLQLQILEFLDRSYPRAIVDKDVRDHLAPSQELYTVKE